MDLRSILFDSFRLLRAQPKVFIPRLITTALYTAVLLLLINIMPDPTDLSHIQDPRGLMSKALLLLLFMPFLYLLDMLSYAMYSSIVADYKNQRPTSLTKAFRESLKAWLVIVVLGVVIFSMALLSSAALVAAVILSYVTGSPIPLALGLVLALFLLIFFAVVAFFVVPSAVIEGKGLAASFSESFRLGMAHKGDLIQLNVVFLVLILATTLLGYVVKSDDLMSVASVILIVLVRVIVAVVYTYLSVVNPTAYLSVKR